MAGIAVGKWLEAICNRVMEDVGGGEGGGGVRIVEVGSWWHGRKQLLYGNVVVGY